MSLVSVVSKIIPSKLRTNINNMICDVADYYLSKKRFSRPYIKRKCIEGVSFDFYIGDADGMVWYDTTCTDPFWPEMRLIKDNLISHGDVILDVGAHHGCTAILFSNWTGSSGRVIAIEPNPSNVQIIKTNIEINHLDNIEVLNVAVGEEKGRLNLSIKNSNSFLIKGEDPLSIPVDIIALDSLSDVTPDFIKFDVEGADVLALRGAKNILKTYPKLAIEIHKDSLSKYSTTLDELLSLVDFDAYDCWIQWNYEDIIGKWQYKNYENLLADGKKMVTGTHIFAKPK